MRTLASLSLGIGLVFLLVSSVHGDDLFNYKTQFERSYAQICTTRTCPLQYAMDSQVHGSLLQEDGQYVCQNGNYQNPLVAGNIGDYQSSKFQRQTCATTPVTELFAQEYEADEAKKLRVLSLDDGDIFFPSHYRTEKLKHDQAWYNNAMFAPRELVIVLSASYSMSLDENYDRALALLSELLDSLTEKDRVGLMVLHHDRVYVRPANATMETKNSLLETASDLIPFGQASSFEALRQGYVWLDESDYDLRSIVLISDGNLDFDLSVLEDLDRDVYVSTTMHTMSTTETITPLMKILGCYGSGIHTNYVQGWGNLFRLFERESGKPKVIVSYGPSLEPEKKGHLSKFESLVLHDVNEHPPTAMGVVAVQTGMSEMIESELRKASLNGHAGISLTFTLEETTYRFWSGNSIDSCELEALRENRCGVEDCIRSEVPSTCEDGLPIQYAHRQTEELQRTNVGVLGECSEGDQMETCYDCIRSIVSWRQDYNPKFTFPRLCPKAECHCTLELCRYRDWDEFQTGTCEKQNWRLHDRGYFDFCKTPDVQVKNVNWKDKIVDDDSTSDGCVNCSWMALTTLIVAALASFLA